MTDDKLLARLRTVETATIGHLREDGFMAPAIQQLHDGPPICGPALTVRTTPLDGSWLIRAVAAARPGDVLVVERAGDDRHACWGSVLTAAAQAAGIAAVVVDGYVTDAGALRKAGFPVWCRGRSPVTTKSGAGPGSLNETILCAGTKVRPGDLILADESGVCVIDPAEAADLAEAALAMQAREPGLIARLASGEPVAQVFPLPSPQAGAAPTPAQDGPIEVPVISDGLRRLGAPVSALSRAAGLLFTCGMPPLDVKTGDLVPGDIETQTGAALDALEHSLRQAGASLRDVVKVNVFMSDLAEVGGFNAVYRARFGDRFPVRTTVGVKPWGAAFAIEIECVARDPQGK
jgi:4-hydroxy-4-methyl-2-oxoglutarate aldolase